MNTYMKGVIVVTCDNCGHEHLAEFEDRQELPGTPFGLRVFNRCECGRNCHIEVWRALNSVTCPFCLGHGYFVGGEFCEACDGNGWIERNELEREIKERNKTQP